eukprot:Ihof_evm14s14 gene=Ihof_evmTU14s14
MSRPGLTVGDTVLVNNLRGILRFLGTTQFKAGEWAGIELEEAEGKNDGSVAGVQYFTCPPAHGLFIISSKVVKVPSVKRTIAKDDTIGSIRLMDGVPGSLATGINRPGIRTISNGTTTQQRPRANSASTIKLGSEVIAVGGKRGILRYMGQTKFAPGEWAGIELPDATGKNDGSVMGERYFSCPKNHGLFCTLAKVILVPSTETGVKLGTAAISSISSTSLSQPVATPMRARPSNPPRFGGLRGSVAPSASGPTVSKATAPVPSASTIKKVSSRGLATDSVVNNSAVNVVRAPVSSEGVGNVEINLEEICAQLEELKSKNNILVNELAQKEALAIKVAELNEELEKTKCKLLDGEESCIITTNMLNDLQIKLDQKPVESSQNGETVDENELLELNTQLMAYKDKIASLQSDFDKMQGLLTVKTEALVMSEDMLADMHGDLDRTKRELEIALKSTAEPLMESNTIAEALNEEIMSYQEKNTSLQAHLDNMQSQLEEKTEALEISESMLTELQDELDRSKQELEIALQTTNKPSSENIITIEELRQQLSEYEKVNNDLQDELLGTQTALFTVEAEAKEKDICLHNKTEALKVLQTTSETTEFELHCELETAKCTYLKESEELRASIAAQTLELTEARHCIEQQKQALTGDMDATKLAMQTEIDKLGCTIGTLEQKVITLESERDRAISELSELAESKQTLDMQVQMEQTAQEEANKALFAEQKATADLTSQLTSVEQQRVLLENQLIAERTTVAELEIKLVKLAASTESTEQSCTSIRGELEEIKKEKMDAMSEVARLVKSVEETELTLQGTKEDLEKAVDATKVEERTREAVEQELLAVKSNSEKKLTAMNKEIERIQEETKMSEKQWIDEREKFVSDLKVAQEELAGVKKERLQVEAKLKDERDAVEERQRVLEQQLQDDRSKLDLQDSKLALELDNATAEITIKENKLVEVKRQLETTVEEKHKLTVTVEGLEKDQGEKVVQIKEKDERIENLLEALKKVENERDASVSHGNEVTATMIKQINDLKAEIEEANQSMVTMATSKDVADKALSEATELIKQKEELLATMTAANQQAKVEAAAAVSALQSQLGEVQEKNSDLSQQLQDELKRLDDVQFKLEEAEKTAYDGLQKVELKEKELTEANIKVDQLTSDLNNVKEELSTVVAVRGKTEAETATTVSFLNSQLTEEKQKSNLLSQQLQDEAKRLGDVQTRLDRIVKEGDDSLQQAELKEKELVEATRKVEQLTSDLQTIQIELANRSKEDGTTQAASSATILALQSQLSEADNKNSDLTQQLQEQIHLLTNVQSSLDEAVKERADLLQQNELREKELVETGLKVDQLTSQLQSVETELESVVTANEVAEAAEAAAATTVSSLQSQLAEEKQKHNDLSQKLQNELKRLDDVQARLDGAESEGAARLQQAELMEKELEIAVKNGDQLTSELQELMEKREEERYMATAEVAEMKRMIIEREKEAADMNKKATEANEVLERVQDELSAMSIRAVEAEKRVAETLNDLEAKKTELLSLSNNDNQELQKQIHLVESLHKKLEESTQLIAQLQSEASKHAELAEKYQLDTANLSATIDKLQSECTIAATRIEENNSEKEALAVLLSQLQTEIADQVTRTEVINQQMTDQTTQITQLQSDLAAKSAENAEIQTKVSSSEAALMTAQAELQEVKANHLLELDQVKQQAVLVEDNNTSLMATVTELKQTVATLTIQLGDEQLKAEKATAAVEESMKIGQAAKDDNMAKILAMEQEIVTLTNKLTAEEAKASKTAEETAAASASMAQAVAASWAANQKEAESVKATYEAHVADLEQQIAILANKLTEERINAEQTSVLAVKEQEQKDKAMEAFKLEIAELKQEMMAASQCRVDLVEAQEQVKKLEQLNVTLQENVDTSKKMAAGAKKLAQQKAKAEIDKAVLKAVEAEEEVRRLDAASTDYINQISSSEKMIESQSSDLRQSATQLDTLKHAKEKLVKETQELKTLLSDCNQKLSETTEALQDTLTEREAQQDQQETAIGGVTGPEMEQVMERLRKAEADLEHERDLKARLEEDLMRVVMEKSQLQHVVAETGSVKPDREIQRLKEQLLQKETYIEHQDNLLAEQRLELDKYRLAPSTPDDMTNRDIRDRIYCEHCGEFDKHTTEDCPPIPGATPRKVVTERRMPMPRPYCTDCE